MQRNKHTFGRNVLFAVLFVLYFLLSSSVMPLLDGTKPGIVPDIMLCLCCVAPLFLERRTACVMALVAGAFTDLFVMPPFHFSPVLFFLAAYFIPEITKVFSKLNAAGAATGSVLFLLARGILGTFYLISQFSGASFANILTKCIIPEFLINFAFVIITYFVASLAARLFRLREYS